MAPLSDEDELKAAWRALEAGGTQSGWRTIQIAADAPSPLFAGRRFPENEEALVVGFQAKRVTVPQLLPQGRGFEVGKADVGPRTPGHVWIALRRLAAGR